MLVNDTEIFLKKRETKSKYMIANDIKIFLIIKTKAYKKNYFKIQKNKTVSKIKTD